MNQDLAGGLLSLFVLTGISTISEMAVIRKRRRAQETEVHVLDVFSTHASMKNPRSWLQASMPPNVPCKVVKGRLWVDHPITVNGEWCLTFSYSDGALFVVDEQRVVHAVPWEHVNTIGVSLDPERRKDE